MKKKAVFLLVLCCLLFSSGVYAGEQRQLYTLADGDAVIRQDDSIMVLFSKPRLVLSTSSINGGCREELRAVFNHDISASRVMTMEAYRKDMEEEATHLGLSPDKVSSMGTAAQMDNVAIRTETFQDAAVTAIVTAGVEGNAGRAGDPTNYYNPKQKPMMPKPGTINIMLVINADMPKGTLARALVTCTEAKTAALQELMVGSRYSNGLATGTGTDQTIVIANPEAGLYLDDAGKHSKLGELIGLAVKAAVKEALVKQNGLTPQKQHSIVRRLARFGITDDELYQDYLQAGYEMITKDKFLQQLHGVSTNGYLVTQTSLYVHLLDQYEWGLLSAEEVTEAGNELIQLVAGRYQLEPGKIQESSLTGFTEAWKKLLLACMHKQLFP